MYPTMIQWNDQELARSITGFFQDRQLTDVTAIEIQAAGGVIVMRGRVGSERDRVLCLQCCRHVAGVVRVDDQLQVTRDEDPVTGNPVIGNGENEHPSTFERSTLCLPTMS